MMHRNVCPDLREPIDEEQTIKTYRSQLPDTLPEPEDPDATNEQNNRSAPYVDV
jgi:hypothetical protein